MKVLIFNIASRSFVIFSWFSATVTVKVFITIIYRPYCGLFIKFEESIHDLTGFNLMAFIMQSIIIIVEKIAAFNWFF